MYFTLFFILFLVACLYILFWLYHFLLKGLRLWVRVIVFDANYNIMLQLYSDGQFFFMVVETRVPGKTTHLPQVTTKLYHMVLFRVHTTIDGIRSDIVSG